MRARGGSMLRLRCSGQIACESSRDSMYEKVAWSISWSMSAWVNYKGGLGSSKVYVMDNEILPSLYYLPWSKKPHQTPCLMCNNNNHHNHKDYHEDDGNYETKGSPTRGHEHHKNSLFPRCLRSKPIWVAASSEAQTTLRKDSRFTTPFWLTTSNILKVSRKVLNSCAKGESLSIAVGPRWSFLGIALWMGDLRFNKG